MTPNRQHAISHGTIEVIWILPHDLCLPNIDTVAACNNYSFILDLSQPFWCTDQLINNHNSLMKFLISLLNTAVRVLISLKCHSSSVCMHRMHASVWILTTVTGHGCRGHLVDNRPLMGGGPAQHGFSLDPLWNILLCHLPLRAYGKNNIRSPILRTQVGLTSTKQWELHHFMRIHDFNWAFSNTCKQ